MLNIGAGEGRLRPPSNPRPTAPLREQRADGERRPPNPRPTAPLRKQHADGERRPPNPRPAAPLREQRADGGRRPPDPRDGAPKAEPRTVMIAARVTRAEHAAWKEKAAAAGVSPSALLRQAMARTRAWTAPALAVERERTRQVARVGNNLNQIARWANTHPSKAEAVEVVAQLVSVERALLALARLGGEDTDAH